MFRWIKKNDLKKVWLELKKIGLSSNGAQEITDVEGKMLPAYELFLAGQHQNTNGLTKLGERLRVRIPAKRVPNALKSILTHYKENRNENEKFNDFFERVGNKSFEELLQEFHINGQFNEEEKEVRKGYRNEPSVGLFPICA